MRQHGFLKNMIHKFPDMFHKLCVSIDFFAVSNKIWHAVLPNCPTEWIF